MIKLRPITEKSWLVLTDTMDRIGLLSEQQNKFILLIKGLRTSFDNKTEINNFFNEDIFSNVTKLKEDSSKEFFIDGYLADFNNPHEISDDHALPLYAKTPTSKIYYAAGYYCVNFPKGHMPAFCPKLATLDKYGYEGPYKSDKEMKFILAKLRKEKR